jgi:uncharacterized membrane protein YphA (DoxX/SURF4 family)
MADFRIHYRTGRIMFGLVPIIAGVDKFTNLLADWSVYLSPALAGLLPVDPQTFMYIVGVIEIAAGLAVLSPLVYYAALVVAAWLVAISINLVVAGYYDVAVRDLVMAAGAFYLAGLARVYGPALTRQRVGAESSVT